jgi:hypothetical protein
MCWMRYEKKERVQKDKGWPIFHPGGIFLSKDHLRMNSWMYYSIATTFMLKLDSNAFFTQKNDIQ